MVTRQEFHRQWGFGQPGLWERSEDIKQDKTGQKSTSILLKEKEMKEFRLCLLNVSITIIETLSFLFPPNATYLLALSKIIWANYITVIHQKYFNYIKSDYFMAQPLIMNL